MRIRLGSGLLLLNLLTWLLIATILFFPYESLRITIGSVLVVFFPGYALVVALFPKEGRLGGIERVVLSFGISIAVVPLIGVILNYTPLGITLESVLYSLASFVFVVSIIALVRSRGLQGQERFRVEFQLRLLGWGGSASDKVLSIALLIAILGALGMLGYVLAMPKLGERISEFYIVGQAGKATGYLGELKVGETGKVVVGIINREYRAVSYRIEVWVDRVKSNEVEPPVLENNDKWEGEVSFVPHVAGGNQKVEFFLYKDREAEPCFKPLGLWIDVREQ